MKLRALEGLSSKHKFIFEFGMGNAFHGVGNRLTLL